MRYEDESEMNKEHILTFVFSSKSGEIVVMELWKRVKSVIVDPLMIA